MTAFDVVIPTIGRPQLRELFAGLSAGTGPDPERVLVVDDRREYARPLALEPGRLAPRLTVLRSGGGGPAAARNVGWRAASAPWIAFLDDDVVPTPTWASDLLADLADLGDDVAGCQGRVRVPLPQNRRPTDWERNVAGLEHARWATADLAYRRSVLAAIGGFDERFGDAYREDSDLGLRIVARNWSIAQGRRCVLHPVRPTGRWISLRKQRGNADDVLMTALHGSDWRLSAGAPRGRLRRHAVTTAMAATALGTFLAGRRRLASSAAVGWVAATAELAWARIAPGPRSRGEVATMLVTSVALPPLAVAHHVRGRVTLRRRLAPARPRAVLFDRDGTLVVDVPYNGDPDRVRPQPGARAALELLRAAGIPTAVVSNQSGIGRGVLSEAQVRAVNARIEQLLGPLGPWLWCPHAPEDRCACRKPMPELIERAARELGVAARDCAVVGDIGADVVAARAAGARAVLVPTAQTLPEEIAAAPERARDLLDAVEMLLGVRR